MPGPGCCTLVTGLCPMTFQSLGSLGQAPCQAFLLHCVPGTEACWQAGNWVLYQG